MQADIDLKGIFVMKFEGFDFSCDFERFLKDFELKIKKQDTDSLSSDLFRKEISHFIKILFEEELIVFFYRNILGATVTGRIGTVERMNFFNTGKNDLILIFLLVFP